MRRKLFIKTYGCQMNEYDSDKIAQAVKSDYDQTTDVNEADLIVFNTCSIREKAQEKVFSDIGRVKHLKKTNGELIIAVGGCVASQEGRDLIKRCPLINIVFGPQTLHRIPQLIAKYQQSLKPQVDISFPEIEKFDSLATQKIDQNTKVSEYVSIMEGCSKYCSYCVVPYTRGEEISRKFSDVMDEIHQLVKHGTKEVNLLGQNVNAYSGIMDDGEVADFALLLEHISAIPQIVRIRYTTSHPNEMTQRLINCYKTLPKLVSHLHLPVQSASDHILSAMKRGYTCLEYKSILRKIKSIRPDISFSSDFIIGFPGETNEDFLKTLDLIDEIKYDMSFSFVFSPRPGTPAANLADDTPMEVKLSRLAQVQAKLDAYAKAISASMVGTTQEILVESLSKRDGQVSGRTPNFKVVNFLGDERLIGQLVNVQITEVRGNTLYGHVV